jgi:hypothetical protein
MKRYLIPLAAVAVILSAVFLPRPHHVETSNARPVATSAPLVLARARRSPPPNSAPATGDPSKGGFRPGSATPSQDYDSAKDGQEYRELPDLPIALYGLVLDQDGNTLRNVTIDAQVTQWDPDARPTAALKIAHVEGQTTDDGRFLLGGVSGHTVTITRISKDGYEPEWIRSPYAEYGAEAGTITEPIVFRMWNTNLHEALTTGDWEFKIIPDGRHYGVDLSKGTIAEGEDGDLVFWIKRAPSSEFPRRCPWSCGLAASRDGGLQPENSSGAAAHRAPVGQYTNTFKFEVDGKAQGWTGMTLDNRFYLKLRNGLYARLSANFWATYRDWQTYRQDTSFGQIHLSYAINPSGSRVLR